MVEATIHELIISEGAKFDYAFLYDKLVGDFGSDLPPNFRINKEIISETEMYLATNKKVRHKHYLRLKYIDEINYKELMLFIIRRKQINNIQKWELVGISLFEDWNEDLEECGQIRAWYETKIVDIPQERDWVLEKNTYKILDKLEEIRDVGEYEDYIEARERVARELSKPQGDGGRIAEIKPGRIKYHLKKGYYNSYTAIEIIRELDSIIDRCRTRVSEFDL